MSRAAWLAPLSVLLLLAMFVTGCVGSGPHSCENDAPSVTSASGRHAGPAVEKVGGSGEGMVVVVVSVAFGVAVVLDTLMLPVTLPEHCPYQLTLALLWVLASAGGGVHGH
jgi:hypothetical protein